jgi:hypothetical protein
MSGAKAGNDAGSIRQVVRGERERCLVAGASYDLPSESTRLLTALSERLPADTTRRLAPVRCRQPRRGGGRPEGAIKPDGRELGSSLRFPP